MTDKPKFPRRTAAKVADELLALLKPYCEPGFLTVAGSFRRGKAEVGDLEILYVSKPGEFQKDGEMFATACPQVDVFLEMLVFGKLAKRVRADDSLTWGAQIKLAVHRHTQLPVDFFATTQESWFNYLVCRTGSAESNMAICKAARARGLKWKPYSRGFCAADDPSETIVQCVNTEEGVFDIVGLPYREPKDR